MTESQNFNPTLSPLLEVLLFLYQTYFLFFNLPPHLLHFSPDYFNLPVSFFLTGLPDSFTGFDKGFLLHFGCEDT
jgi:hypothetical protein